MDTTFKLMDNLFGCGETGSGNPYAEAFFYGWHMCLTPKGSTSVARTVDKLVCRCRPTSYLMMCVCGGGMCVCTFISL